MFNKIYLPDHSCLWWEAQLPSITDAGKTPSHFETRSGSKVRIFDDPPTWMPIETAPKDCDIVVYCPPAHGIRHMASICRWHEDAGFCVDELREPAFWISLPNAKAQTRPPLDESSDRS